MASSRAGRKKKKGTGKADRRSKKKNVAGGGSGPPSKKEKGGPSWKAVEMDMDLMQEFEAEGGVFIEEADEEVCLTYSDGRKEVVGGKGAKAQRPQRELQPPQSPAATEKKSLKQKKKKAKDARRHEEAGEARPIEDAAASEAPAGKKRKLVGAGSDDSAADRATASKVPEEEEAVPDLPEWLQFELHPQILGGLNRLGFRKPTAVQARCLIPAIRQRKDIVGAAETGSGKTLAFGLPILHHTLTSLDFEPLAPSASSSSSPPSSSGTAVDPWKREGGVRGLVVLPTRELAVQVQSHINAAAQCSSVRAECVVGGIALPKQRRLLGRRPHIVVGTPGRLFALLGLGKKADEERCDWLREGVKDLRHLVLDEADRLVESGHFKELDSILHLVYNSLERAQQLQTFVFSATLTLDPRSAWQRRKQGDDEDGGKVGALMRRLQFRETRAVHTVDLTRPEEASASSASVAAAKAAADAAAARSGGAAGAGAEAQSNTRLPERLALQEAVSPDDKDKEAILAMWLLRRYRWNAAAGGPAAAAAAAACMVAKSETKEEREAAKASLGGRVVLFVNAISSVLRLTSVLSLLLESPSAGKVLSRVRLGNGKGDTSPGISVDVLGLHSQMKQKDRLQRMERFRSLQHAVLVCTDIAARGLDVPEVKAVLHFQAPRSAEIFVHRSGRTARAGCSGESVAFVGPGDAGQWTKVYRATDIGRERVGGIDVNSNELNASREAIRLAVDLESKVHKLHKQTGERSWLRRAAEEADLAISEDEGDADRGKDAAPRRQLWGLYQQLQARVRRPPRRTGAGPQPRRGRR